MASMMRIYNTIKNVGFKETMKKFFYMRDWKYGTLVGEDRLGNKYFENLNEAFGLGELESWVAHGIYCEWPLFR